MLSGVNSSLALKANIASPTFTGVPLAPTASVATNNTQLATTAFVQSQKASPAFTGTPTAPTASAATNNTQVATTAYVKNQVASITQYALLTDATQDITANNIIADSLKLNTGEGLYLTQAGTGWRVWQSGTTLYFSYNGNNVLSLTTSGTLTTEGNVQGYGTV